MTLDKYLITNVLKTFKLYNGAKSLAFANSESHLIHDGLKILGYSNREYIEEIDDLKGTYWEIQDLSKELNQLQENETLLTNALNDAMNKREQKQNQDNEHVIAIRGEKQTLLRKQQELNIRQEAIEEEGRSTVKIHQGLKAEKEHLEEQNSTEVDQKIKSCLQELKTLKAQRDATLREHAAVSEAIKQKEALIQEAQKETSSESTEKQHSVSESNKKLSNNRVNQTKLRERLDNLLFEVGEYLLNNQRDRDVRKCTKSQRRILKQIKALKKSVEYHRKLGHR